MPFHRPFVRDRGPWLLLVALMGLTAAGLQASGRLTAVEVPDTASYRDFPWTSFSAALGHLRTPGYPLFLQIISRCTGSLSATPTVQLMAYFGGVLLFAGGLRAAGGSGWSASLIAASLCGSNILCGYVQTLATDTLAAALGIATVGALLMMQEGKPVLRYGGLLAVLVTAGWLVRPAYLSLAMFVPVAGAVLEFRRFRAGSGRGECLRRWCVLLLAVSIPLLGWCVLRWCVVGRFGIVSFGGFNLVGVTGQFLDESLVDELPADLQPLARAALARRKALPPEMIAMPEADVLNYQRMESNYDVTIGHVYAPAAVELYGNDNAMVNTQLQRFARAIIQARPASYGEWLLKAYRRALVKLVGDFVGNPLGLMLTTFGAGLMLFALTVSPPHRPLTVNVETGEITQLLFIVTLLYAMLQILTIIVVCPPLGRLVDAAGVWLPALATSVVLDLLQRCRLIASCKTTDPIAG